MAPLIQRMASQPEVFDAKVCVTAQHRGMLDQTLKLFGIAPNYDLNVMVADQSPTQVAAAVLSNLEPILKLEKPDWVLLQGDTTTTAAAALASFYAGVKIGHLEAGLRTQDKSQPFPEEINRRVVSVIADLHFAATETARQNLLTEGISPQRIVVTGNPVIDALQSMLRRPAPPEVARDLLPRDLEAILREGGVRSTREDLQVTVVEGVRGNRDLRLVDEHRHEFGVRVALGAAQSTIVRLVVGESFGAGQPL